MDLDQWKYLERQRKVKLHSSPGNQFANVLSPSGYFMCRRKHIFKKIQKHLVVLSMCALAICLLISPFSAEASPLQALIEQYGLTPHSVTYDGPIGVKLPSGTLIIRYEVIRFGPSPFPLTLELNYDPESSAPNGISPGWSLGGTPWHGYNIDWKTSWGENNRMVSRTSDGGKSISYRYDAKGRLAFPTRYREDLMTRCEGRVVLTVHDDRCLLLYPQPDWDEIERKLVRLPNQNKRTRTLQRMVLGHATEIEMDKSGRILVPPRLREFASLEKRVVLAGLGNKFEIWNEEAWEKKCTEWMSDDGDDLPDSLETLTL